jgi:hypothetical protein
MTDLDRDATPTDDDLLALVQEAPQPQRSNVFNWFVC